MAPVSPQHVYPALRSFFEEAELAKTLKAFNKETIPEGEEAKKPKKALKALNIVNACEVACALAELTAWDVYPVVRAFLEQNELAKSVKMFDKETADEEPRKGKKAKALRALDLVEASQAWVEAQASAVAEDAPVEAPAATEPQKASKKRKSEEQAEEAEAAEEEPAEVAQPKKKRRKSQQEEDVPANDEPAEPVKEAAPAATEEAPKPERKKKEKKEKEEKPTQRYSRIDADKWAATIKDDRLRDNTHLAKNRFGDSAGDSWGDIAAVDMLKVKGKGFRKEMQKKKRASWRGVGELDQGVNSVKFSDSEDE